MISKLFKGIWNDYVDIQHKNMLDLLWFCIHEGFIFLGYPTFHYKVSSTNVSKYKPMLIRQPYQLIQVKSYI